MLKNIFILVSLMSGFLFGKSVTVNIVSDKFSTNQSKNITKFIGHVKMTKEKDILKCNQLTIYTKEKTKTSAVVAKEYIAIGNVSFKFATETTTFKGKGDKILYYPLDSKYIVIGNGYLEDMKDGKILIGDKIYIDEKTGNANIEGKDNKPVKFTFQIETKDKNETN